MQTFADELSSESATSVNDSTEPTQNDATSKGADGDSSSSAGESSNERSTGDNGATPGTEPSKDDTRTVPLRALEDEREKRQYERQLREAQERRLAELEARIAATTQAKTDEPSIDYEAIWENPKAVFEAHERARGQQSRAQVMEASREMARAHFPDYDETIQQLSQMDVPGLEQAIAKSPTPAFTAYRMIKAEAKKRASAVDATELQKLQAQLEEARKELDAYKGEATRPPVSLSQSRSGSGGVRQAVRTQEDILSAAWDRPLRARK